MSDEAAVKAEWVSALMDGALRDAELVRAIDYLEDSANARETWDTYHLVGEVLRSGKSAGKAYDAAFVARLRTKLSSSDLDDVAVVPNGPNVAIIDSSDAGAANDGWWRRVVGLTSVAVMGVLVWQAALWVGAGGIADNAPALAQLPAQPVTVAASVPTALPTGEVPVMLRDPQLDALLAAHRQHGGVTALQMPAGFLRNATFTEVGR